MTGYEDISALTTLRTEPRRIATPQEMDEWLKVSEAEVRGLRAIIEEKDQQIQQLQERLDNVQLEERQP